MLENVSKKKKIIERVRIAESFYAKFKGLMFESRKRFDYALVFDMLAESKLSCTIHMLFVFFPIDVIFLDEDKRVVDIARNLKPFKLSYTPKKAARYFVELPLGKISGIEAGDEICW